MSDLPRWNTASLFPSLSSPEFQAEFDGVVADVQSLQRSFDDLDIRAGGNVADPKAALERSLAEMNALYTRLRPVSAFIQAFVTTNSKDELAQARASELGVKTVALGQLGTRWSAWVGGLANLEELISGSEAARAHQFALHKAALSAKHQMTPQEEELASLLNLSGGGAWGKLHGNITSTLLVDFRGQKLPMSAIRNLASDPEANVRREAYQAELSAWEGVEVPLAAALNGIKGQVNVLNKRRDWADSVEPTLLQNSIDRETLSAMQRACVDSFPDFRRYFQAKARLLGKDALPFYDLFAPVGKSGKAWEYPEATAFVVEQFGTYSQKLSDFAARAFDENWIDVPPAPGKRDGAFCMGWRGDESRILMNYEQSLDSVSTLAHELGHGYHNLCLAGRTPLQKSTPMTLAETASIFCETIAVNAALREASGNEKLYILETQLQGQAQVVVDIHSRFLFEQSVFEGREARDLSPRELKDLMLRAQKETYGDGLSGELHPYMWAVKGHYYSANLSYYNYPYTFGLLFGLGLYAIYQQNPDEFRAGYDELLSSTGLADAATLAARFGIDTRSEEFWHGSLNVIRANIDEYEKMAREAVMA